MQKKTLIVIALFFAAAIPAFADVSVMIAIEPTSRTEGYKISRPAMQSGLTKLLGQDVTVSMTEDLTDVMRSTRSKGYDVFIGPAQVVASAIAHGYGLLGSTTADEQYVLVSRSGLASAGELRKGRLYLPQQDSIYTYLARGLLTANGLSFKDMSKVEHAHYPQAGLAAIGMRAYDATVVRREDWELWQKSNVGVGKVLATSGAVPGGLSVAVKKDMSPDVRARLTQWFANPAPSTGMKSVEELADVSKYQRVAELGTFTPTSLPGATVVNAEDVKLLLSKGAVLVDTRTEKEYKARHIPAATFVPYHEKSLKDVGFDATLDDFSGIKTLNSKTPTIFHCNGPECWKSYKASRAALANGFTKVYWYRGGMPDWESFDLKVASK